MMAEQGVEKVLSDPACRVCGGGNVEAAHLVHRSRGAKKFSEADLIVPLCRVHHHAFDFGQLELLPYLSNDEQAAAVRLLGIVRAYDRLTCGDSE